MINTAPPTTTPLITSNGSQKEYYDKLALLSKYGYINL